MKLFKTKAGDIEYESSIDSEEDLKKLVTPSGAVVQYPAPVVIRLEASSAINFTDLVRTIAHRLNRVTHSVEDITASLDEMRAALKQLADESTVVIRQDGSVSVPSGTKVYLKK